MKKYYLGLDGDNIGREIERLIIDNKKEEVKAFSNKIAMIINYLTDYLSKQKIEIIFSGGDSILAYGEITEDVLSFLLSKFKTEVSKTVSIGIGDTLSEAYLGLKLAKSYGGNQFINYSRRK